MSGGPPAHSRHGSPMKAAILSESNVPRTEHLAGPPPAWSPGDPPDLTAAARAYREFREHGDADEWQAGEGDNPRHTEVFHLVHQQSPEGALKLAEAATRLPAVGERFASFRL